MINSGGRHRNGGRGGRRRGRGGGGASKKTKITSATMTVVSTTTPDETCTVSSPETMPSKSVEGTTTIVSTPKPVASHADEGADDDSSMCMSWITSALKTFGHPTPNDKGNSINDDGVFQEIVIFLEDRCIRLWDLEQRNATIRQPANFFDSHLSTYLKAVGCPFSYNENMQSSPEQRYHVLHWLICYAMKEVYNDTFQNSSSIDDKNIPPSSAIAIAPVVVSQSATTTTTTSYPLGFSTGDNQVDELLTMIRMQMVLDMAEHQQIINERIIAAAEASHQQLKSSSL